MTAPARAAVVGPTAWGTTLAILLARNAVPTTLVARTVEEARGLEAARQNEKRLPGFAFPPSLHVAAGPDALRGIDLLCIAVPSRTIEQNARAIADAVPLTATVLSATKGIERGTGRRMSQLLWALLPGRPLAVLSGPNLSREVAAGLPGTTVIASASADLEMLRDAFHSPSFRVYTSTDAIGVELGGALKNIIAIAGGMADALRYGDNAKAAIITRGLAEITRLGVAAGAEALTFQGLAGVGDAIATSYSQLSRNRRLGELIASGSTLDEALEALQETAEGATTIPAALALAARLGVEMPITRELNDILYRGVSPQAAVEVLLGRTPGPELAL